MGKDRCVKSLQQVEAEQVLLNHDKMQHWVDLMLGMTRKQLDEHERECATQAKLAEGKEGGYNFEIHTQ